MTVHRAIAPSIRRACQPINECSEDAAATWLPVIEAVLTACAPARELKSNSPTKKEPASDKISDSRLCALCVRLFAEGRVQFHNINQNFSLTLRTIELEFNKDSILIHLCSCFPPQIGQCIHNDSFSRGIFLPAFLHIMLLRGTPGLYDYYS